MTEQKQPLVIGITGKAGAGKDSLASLLLEQLFEKGIRAKIVRLADPLKEAYAALFCLNRDDLERFDFKNEVNKFTGNTHRQELQFLGTEAYRVRTGNPHVWVQVLEEKVSQLRQNVQVVIVPDIRFDNEAAYALLCGRLIRIIREDNPETISNHASEAGVSQEADWTVANNGSLEDLGVQATFLTTSIVENFE